VERVECTSLYGPTRGDDGLGGDQPSEESPLAWPWIRHEAVVALALELEAFEQSRDQG
jgi:hypothetical protein